MVLLDSNLVIYAARRDDAIVVPFIESLDRVYVSEISIVESLGYRGIERDEQRAVERILASSVLLPISREVIDGATGLRQRRRMSLGDALVAATAIVHRLTLATRNAADFVGIEGLSVVDPFQPT